MSPRLIVALDCDCFYAQCEVLRDPSLAGKPVGVRQKQLLVTCNYAARAFGIKKCHGLRDAKKLCPSIVIRDGEDLTFYTAVSNEWRAFLKAETGCAVEATGLDECFVDATRAVEKRLRETTDGASEKVCGHVHGARGPDFSRYAAAAFCEELRAATKARLGLETSGGVSCNKLLAKRVAGMHKPYAQTTLAKTPANVMLALPDDEPCRALPGVGRGVGPIN